MARFRDACFNKVQYGAVSSNRARQLAEQERQQALLRELVVQVNTCKTISQYNAVVKRLIRETNDQRILKKQRDMLLRSAREVRDLMGITNENES